MEKLESMKKFDTNTYIMDIENQYRNLKEEIEVKVNF